MVIEGSEFIEKSGIASDCKGNNHRGSEPKVPFAVYKSIVERYNRNGATERDTERQTHREKYEETTKEAERKGYGETDRKSDGETNKEKDMKRQREERQIK